MGRLRGGRARAYTPHPGEGTDMAKPHEGAFQESLHRFAAIVQDSDDAIFTKDPRGIITDWNRAAERIYGYTAAEAIGQHVGLLVPPERAGEVEDILERVMQGERVDHYETLRRARDGRIIEVSLTVSPVRDADGEIREASVTARDVTDRRALERRIDELDDDRRRLLAQALGAEDRERRRLASRIHDQAMQLLALAAHDLSTLRARGTTDDRVADAETAIRQAMSDLRAALFELVPGPPDQRGELRDHVETLGREYARRGDFDFSCAIDPDAGGVQDGLVLAVVRELISNAARHASPGSVTVHVRREAEALHLSVRDDGVGFAEERLIQAPREGHIGLATHGERLRALGGALEIHRPQDGGTEVRARIPVDAQLAA